MLKAQGRFRALMAVTICFSLLFLSIVGTASHIGYALSVAFGVLIFYCIFAPVQMYVAIRRGGGKFRDIINVFALPLLFSIIAALIGYGAGRLVPQLPLRNAFRIVAITLCTGGVYYLLLQLFARHLYDHVVNAIRNPVIRLWRRPKSTRMIGSTLRASANAQAPTLYVEGLHSMTRCPFDMLAAGTLRIDQVKGQIPQITLMSGNVLRKWRIGKKNEADVFFASRTFRSGSACESTYCLDVRKSPRALGKMKNEPTALGTVATVGPNVG